MNPSAFENEEESSQRRVGSRNSRQEASQDEKICKLNSRVSDSPDPDRASFPPFS